MKKKIKVDRPLVAVVEPLPDGTLYLPYSITRNGTLTLNVSARLDGAVLAETSVEQCVAMILPTWEMQLRQILRNTTVLPL